MCQLSPQAPVLSQLPRELGSVRNIAMDKVAETVLFPCKHAGSGCSKRFLHKEKRQHEEVCEYRPYACPCPGTSCKWLGHLHAVLDHLLTAHKTITTLHGEDIVFLATDIHICQEPWIGWMNAVLL
eukprot:Em0456g2a